MKSLSALFRLVVVSRSIFSKHCLINLPRLTVAGLFLASVAAAHAGTYTVTRFDDTSVGTLETGGGFGPGAVGDLRYELYAAMAAGGVNTINFACASAPCTIVLQAPLPPIYQPTASPTTPYTGTFSLTIDGGTEGNVVIDGNSGGGQSNRVFFVDNVPVTLKNLVIQNATARGGAGADGNDAGGGGGAGFGAGLFVNQSSAVVGVANTMFLNCVAVGGNGGGNSGGGQGGGGGLAFAGGGGNFTAGGGGGGVSGAGVALTYTSGQGGVSTGGVGGTGGGGGGAPTANGAIGYASNAGGGAGTANGGNGGFGGGGGGGSTGTGGAGGFGAGGGGSEPTGGLGGFGGGGGGDYSRGAGSPDTTGGVYGGHGAGGAGGGGAAAGPAIFVVNGSVTLTNVTGEGFGATPGFGAYSQTYGTGNAAPVFNYGGTVNGSGTVGPLDAVAPISVAVGQTSGTMTATVTFTTAGPVGTNNVYTQGAPSGPGQDFKYVNGGTCGTTQTAVVGATCTVLY